MSDIMRPIPFAQLMDWILTEHAEKNSIFGVRKIVKHEGDADPIFAEKFFTFIVAEVIQHHEEIRDDHEAERAKQTEP